MAGDRGRLGCEKMAVPKRKPKVQTPPKKAEMPDAMASLPERLAEAMALEELNATQLAEASLVSKQVITRALKGERLAGMRVASLVKLAEALGVSVGWLAIREGEMRPAGKVGVTSSGITVAEVVRETILQIGYKSPDSQVPQHKLLRSAEDPDK